MNNQTYNALHISYQTGDVSWSANCDVTIPVSDTLAFTRAGSFFTSALINQGKSGPYLLMQEAHYNRLVCSYKTMFERDFKLSFSEFKTHVQSLIQRNAQGGITAPYQLLIYCLGGKADSFNGYTSGLSGDIGRIIFVSNPLASKPEWTFSEGVHVLTLPVQRVLANAKPTNYVSGIKSQHCINAINAAVLRDVENGLAKEISGHTNALVQHYISLSEDEKLAFRLTNNKSRTEKADFLKMESDLYPFLLHESLFTTQDGYILEGPTFSVFAITKNNEVLFIPLHGNGCEKREENDGKILHSTSIQWIEAGAKNMSATVLNEPLHFESLWDLKGLYAVSVTRLDIEKASVRLQPISAVNGKALPVAKADDPFVSALCKSIFETEI